MKSLKPHFIILLSFLMISIGFTSCTVHHHRTVVVKEKRIPPGQAKKMHGDRSAKNYAPGQRKKNKKIIIID